MLNLQAISSQRLYRLIAERIAEKIRDGEFAVGDRLPAERDLAEMLQVSRSSVREALIALELSGYVEVRVGSGVYVIAHEHKNESASRLALMSNNAPEAAKIVSDIGPFELLEARLLIEPECAALAAHQGSEEQLEKIREAHLAMRSSDTSSGHIHDRALHAAIAAACGNSALESIVSHIWDFSEASTLYAQLDKHFVNKTVWDVAHAEHSRIAEAILERDPIRARHAMHVHLIAIMARLREDFAERFPETTKKHAASKAARRKPPRTPPTPSTEHSS